MLNYKIFIGAILSFNGIGQLLAALTNLACNSADCFPGPFLVCAVMMLVTGVYLLIRGLKDQAKSD